MVTPNLPDGITESIISKYMDIPELHCGECRHFLEIPTEILKQTNHVYGMCPYYGLVKASDEACGEGEF